MADDRPSEVGAADAFAGTVVHLALLTDWQEAMASGRYAVSTLGATLSDVGFIHASTWSQLSRTAARFYRDAPGALVVLVLDPEEMRSAGAPVVLEPVGDGERFPHVYGAIPVDRVRAVLATEMTDGELTVIVEQDDHGPA